MAAQLQSISKQILLERGGETGVPKATEKTAVEEEPQATETTETAVEEEPQAAETTETEQPEQEHWDAIDRPKSRRRKE